MRTVELVVRARVMRKIPQWPGAGVVAALALHPICALVLVVLEVATDAVAPRIPEPWSFVTLLADHQSMAARKRKSCTVVVKPIYLPVLVRVAALALGACLALVLVVLLVATDALHRCVAITLYVFVTGFAFDGLGCMRIFQLEPRLVMRKQGRFPIIGRMAIATLLPQIRSMLVVLLVAGKTVLAGLLVHHAFMAGFAFRLFVFTQQGEIGLCVVKANGLRP
jgi:hypothetical protein